MDARVAGALIAVVAAIILFFVLRPEDEEPTRALTGTTTTTQTTTVETTTTTEATTTEPAPPPARRIRIVVEDGQPVGGVQRVSVARGERVVVIVRADVVDEVHVHGYDLTADVGPGQPARIAFRAELTGRFEIELEDRSLLLAELEVTP
jgi:hypothetical protein